MRFYRLVEQGQFGAAAQLWSSRMQAAFPPRENLQERFATTQRLTVRRAEVIALDQAAGRATVAVDLLEVSGAQATVRSWVGTWHLVQGPAGWLLDQPNLRPG